MNPSEGLYKLIDARCVNPAGSESEIHKSDRHTLLIGIKGSGEVEAKGYCFEFGSCDVLLLLLIHRGAC